MNLYRWTALPALAAALAAIWSCPAAAGEARSEAARASFDAAARNARPAVGAVEAAVPGAGAAAAVASLDRAAWRPADHRGRRPGDRDPRFPPPGRPWPRPDEGWRRPGDDWRRPGHGMRALECSATDRGWEEHWGGHVSRGYDLHASRDSACRSCKQPTGPHGSCDVRCVEPEYRCEYEFAPDGGGPAQDTGRGEPRESSYAAEESAMSLCMRANWGRPGRCRIRDCRQEDRTLLWERCR